MLRGPGPGDDFTVSVQRLLLDAQRQIVAEHLKAVLLLQDQLEDGDDGPIVDHRLSTGSSGRLSGEGRRGAVSSDDEAIPLGCARPAPHSWASRDTHKDLRVWPNPSHHKAPLLGPTSTARTAKQSHNVKSRPNLAPNPGAPCQSQDGQEENDVLVANTFAKRPVQFDRRKASVVSDGSVELSRDTSEPPAKTQSLLSMSACGVGKPGGKDEPKGLMLPPIRTRENSVMSTASGMECEFELLPIWTQATKKQQRRSVTGLGTFSRDDEEEDDAAQSTWERKLQKYMLPPNSKVQFAWEVTGILLIIYDVIALPIMLFFAPPEPPVVAWLGRSFWTLNIGVANFMGYMDFKGVVVTQPKRVILHYVKTWLLLDVINVTFDWTELLLRLTDQHVNRGDGDTSIFGTTGNVTRVLRLIRVLRLLRLARAQEMARVIMKNIRSEVVFVAIQIAWSMVFMMGITHILACLWYFVGNAAARSGELSWTQVAGLDSKLDWHQSYLTSFHCALSLLHGEHVVPAENLMERLFYISVLLAGFMISIFFTSSLTTAMTRLSIIAGKRSTQMSFLSRYLTDNNISRRLAVKVEHNAQHALAEQKRNAPESSIELLQLISEPLRQELHFEVHSPLLLMHPFFRCYFDVNPTSSRKICHEAVSRVTFSRGDIVFIENETPAVPRMYFTVKGQMLYMQEECNMQNRVDHHEWVSEAVLWTYWMHRGTFRAASECQLTTLDAMRFQDTVNKFPAVNVRVYAKEFLVMLGSDVSRHTDIGTESARLDKAIHIAFPEISERRSSTRHSHGRESTRKSSGPFRSSGSSWASEGHFYLGAGNGGLFQNMKRRLSNFMYHRHQNDKLACVAPQIQIDRPSESEPCSPPFAMVESRPPTLERPVMVE